ncbi:Uncharacterized protein APZ42_001567, partial [Daphnia magna]
SNSVSDALLNVFSSYYVFYIEYSKQVLKSLLFLQCEVFGLKDDCSINCPGLPLFVNTLNAVKLWIGYYRIIYVGNLLNNHENLGVTTTTNSYCDTIQIFRVWEPQIWFAENLGRLTPK